MAPSPTRTLEKRASTTSSTSSSSTSLDCDGKDKNSSQCEKPSNENGLEIGLGVGIPVFLILVVLGFFLWKNYRKQKKESLEHDPDFDENGEATALPDFPAFTKEDPFANRMSGNPFGRNSNFPPMGGHNRSATDLRSMLTRGAEEGYVDAFMLPYHHQMGSKASLDEYAKQIINQSSSHNRVSSVASRPFSTQPGSRRVSPQKKTQNLDHTQLSAPVGKLRAGDYAHLANQSTNLLATEFYNTKEHFESDETSGETSKASEPGAQFDVEYENELLPAINSTLPKRSERGYGHPDSDGVESVPDEDSDGVESVHDDDSDDDDRGFQRVSSKSHQRNVGGDLHEDSKHSLPSFEVQSPFEDTHQIDKQNESEDELQLPVHVRPAERSDGDFDFSNENLNVDSTIPDETETSKDIKGMTKSPRMSAFNMLKNFSDDEDDGAPIEVENMTADQEEELARMKSVYKVYFDRANSMKSVQGDDLNNRSFQADPSQPLPSLDVDNLKINDELRGDTNYDKRKTTTSSIYEENPIYGDKRDRIVIHPHQKFNAPASNQFAQNEYYAQQQYAMQNPQHEQQESYDAPPRELRPLKSLPHASDIRNSTIETFTDYQPRAKISSPSLRNQGLFENGDQSSSPYMSSQASFASPSSPSMGDVPPTIRNTSGQSSKPSPSQLSRTSVVMLNPVSEIKTQRKFKPAGSLPQGAAPVAYHHGNDELAHSNDDLIPGNRKSAVRRMMNTNF